VIDPASLRDDGCAIAKHLPAFCKRCFGDGLQWEEREPIFPGQLAYVATCAWCHLTQQYSGTVPVLPPGRHPDE
jgi:hypothetical protein